MFILFNLLAHWLKQSPNKNIHRRITLNIHKFIRDEVQLATACGKKKYHEASQKNSTKASESKNRKKSPNNSSSIAAAERCWERPFPVLNMHWNPKFNKGN